MNIFESYIDKIKSILIDLNKQGELLFQKLLMELMQKFHLNNLTVIFQLMLQWFFQN